MKKLFLPLFLSAAMSASVVIVGGGASAQAPEIPAEVSIDDPVGDANYANDGNDSRTAPVGRDHVTGNDASAFGDLMKIWFSNDATTVSVHVQTEAKPPAGNGVGYQVYTNPGEGSEGSSTVGCLRWVLLLPGTNPQGGTYQGPPFVRMHDRCHTGGSFFAASVEGAFVVDSGPSSSGIVTITFPRSTSPLLGEGATLTSPYASSASPLVGTAAQGFVFVTVDNTQIGTDYSLEDESPSCPGKGKGRDKTPRPTTTGEATPNTPPPAPRAAAVDQTPTPTPTATSTGDGADEDKCPPKKDKKKKCPKGKGGEKGKGKGKDKKKKCPKPKPDRSPTPRPTGASPTPTPTST